MENNENSSISIKRQEKTVGPEFIRTVYIPKKGMPEKEQWWLAHISKDYHSLKNLMDHCLEFSLLPINYYIKKLLELRKFDIKFWAVTGPDKRANYSSLYHRGRKEDNDPIIYRGNPIPEITAGIINYTQLNGAILIFSSSSSSYISDGMKSQLGIWFKDQLLNAATDDLLKYLVKEALDTYFNSLQTSSDDLQRNLEIFKVNITKIKDDIAEKLNKK